MHIVFIITLNTRIQVCTSNTANNTHTVINLRSLKTIMDMSCRVAKGQSALTGQPAWPGWGPTTRQEAGEIDCHTMHAYASNCVALSFSSFVNSVCALTLPCLG